MVERLTPKSLLLQAYTRPLPELHRDDLPKLQLTARVEGASAPSSNSSTAPSWSLSCHCDVIDTPPSHRIPVVRFDDEVKGTCRCQRDLPPDKTCLANSDVSSWPSMFLDPIPSMFMAKDPSPFSRNVEWDGGLQAVDLPQPGEDWTDGEICQGLELTGLVPDALTGPGMLCDESNDRRFRAYTLDSSFSVEDYPEQFVDVGSR